MGRGTADGEAEASTRGLLVVLLVGQALFLVPTKNIWESSSSGSGPQSRSRLEQRAPALTTQTERFVESSLLQHMAFIVYFEGNAKPLRRYTLTALKTRCY